MLTLLKSNRLFGVLPGDELNKIASLPVMSVKKGETLCVSGVGMIISGKCDVLRGNGGEKVLFNRIGEGGLFGMARLFGENTEKSGGVTTSVTAKTDGIILSVPTKEIERLVREYPDFAVAYISVLSDKIRFLSRKVTEFSSDGIEERLLDYLRANGGSRCAMTELTKRLGIGRASLYRVLDSLEEKKLIVKNGKTITVTDK